MTNPDDPWYVDDGDPADGDEPIGSCDDCGRDIYEDDWEFLCDQCHWIRKHGED